MGVTSHLVGTTRIGSLGVMGGNASKGSPKWLLNQRPGFGITKETVGRKSNPKLGVLWHRVAGALLLLVILGLLLVGVDRVLGNNVMHGLTMESKDVKWPRVLMQPEARVVVVERAGRGIQMGYGGKWGLRIGYAGIVTSITSGKGVTVPGASSLWISPGLASLTWVSMIMGGLNVKIFFSFGILPC